MNLLCVGVGGGILEAPAKLIIFKKKKKRLYSYRMSATSVTKRLEIYVRLFNCFSAIPRVTDIEKGPGLHLPGEAVARRGRSCLAGCPGLARAGSIPGCRLRQPA